MTEEQWLTARKMTRFSVAELERMGTANVARYLLIDITNAALSRMLLGGPGPDGSDPGFKTQGAISYEGRSVWQKSKAGRTRCGPLTRSAPSPRRCRFFRCAARARMIVRIG